MKQSFKPQPKLYPYQEEGVAFLASHPHALIGDEPGLGKTPQAIVAALKINSRSNIVVCPASVRSHWRKQIAVWGAENLSWYVISYEGAVQASRDHSFGYVSTIILDEAHFCKTPDSQRTQAILGNGTGIARRAVNKWCLTGTPVLNRPRELYPIVKTLASPHLGPYNTWAKYTQRYCAAHFNGRERDTRGSSHEEELGRRLQGFMLRRTKQEVMPWLPPRIVSTVELNVLREEMRELVQEENRIENREAYLSAVKEDYAALGDMARLLRLTGEAKVFEAAVFIQDLVRVRSKVVVFARHRSVMNRLEDKLWADGMGVVQYHGGMNDAQKDAAVNRFKTDDKCDVFIGQIQAAGTGIDGLQEICHCVVFAELSWVPGEMLQAIDRLHRIGQRADSVLAYLLHIPGTLESAVLAVEDRKERVIDKIMGDGRRVLHGGEDFSCLGDMV